jgi:hypothetical protein
MLKVTISGKFGERRNAATLAITNFLRDSGMEIEFGDFPDDLGVTLESDMRTQAKAVGKALDQLRGTKVLVQSPQEPR